MATGLEMMEAPDEEGATSFNMLEEDENGDTVFEEIEEGAEQRNKQQVLQEHFQNLATQDNQSQLRSKSTMLIEQIDEDFQAREARDKLYAEGLRRTGLGGDAPGGANFEGASDSVHPMLTKACVEFCARASKEIFPPNGPAKSKIVGQKDADKMLRASRKSDFLNWQMTIKSPSFKPEIDQMLTQLPLGGSQYIKLTWSQRRRAPVPEMVPIDDVAIPFAASNFYDAERKTHRQYITQLEFERRVKDGMYLDIQLPSAPEPEMSSAEKANQKIEGKKSDPYNEDGLRTIYEVAHWGDYEEEIGIAPYIMMIDYTTADVLGLYRNWDPQDKYMNELIHMIEFGFVPWRGAYCIGLAHMIGKLSGATTGALRALLDSGHVNNIPTALKLKGGPNGQVINAKVGQLSEIEGGPMSDDIRKLIMPLPFNPPSPTLFQLLGFLVDTGNSVVQTSFENLAESNANAPVGTTLALIEQGMVVFSSIHSRLHNSMMMLLSVVQRLNEANLTQEDIDESDVEISLDEFLEEDGIIPVSDPAIFSETQRFAQIQTVMQRADMKPQLYDDRKVEELFLQQIKFTDDILIKKQEPENLDPASENTAMSMGAPTYVLLQQDHLEHLLVHKAFIESPVFGANPVIFNMLLNQMITHIRDHMLQHYMRVAHEAAQLAQNSQLIAQEDAKSQAELQILATEEAAKELKPYSDLLNQLYQIAMQNQQAQAQAQTDPAMAIASMTVQQREQESQRKDKQAQDKLAVDAQNNAQKAALEQQKLEQKDRSEQREDAREQQRLQRDADKEQFKQTQENMRTDKELASKEKINEQDNDTAILLAAAEIESGERIAVSNGGGINPNPNP